MADYLEIGGSFGLDTTNMMTADTVCGVSRDKSQLKFLNKNKTWLGLNNLTANGVIIESSEETIACGTTTVRLVSSGRYHNVATISIRSAGEEDLLSSSFLCPAVSCWINKGWSQWKYGVIELLVFCSKYGIVKIIGRSRKKKLEPHWTINRIFDMKPTYTFPFVLWVILMKKEKRLI